LDPHSLFLFSLIPNWGNPILRLITLHSLLLGYRLKQTRLRLKHLNKPRLRNPPAASVGDRREGWVMYGCLSNLRKGEVTVSERSHVLPPFPGAGLPFKNTRSSLLLPSLPTRYAPTSERPPRADSLFPPPYPRLCVDLSNPLTSTYTQALSLVAPQWSPCRGLLRNSCEYLQSPFSE
jgi:hypothetical protein